VIQLKVIDHLNQEQKRRLEKLKKEKISRKDIEELMGMNMDRYERRRGAMRRK
jgi:hypothetical protein